MDIRANDSTSVAYGDPAREGFAITPNDGADLSANTRALWVGGAGNIVVDFVGSGSSITIAGVPAGTLLPFEVKRVRATGTTATNIVGLR